MAEHATSWDVPPLMGYFPKWHEGSRDFLFFLRFHVKVLLFFIKLSLFQPMSFSSYFGENFLQGRGMTEKLGR